MKEQVTKIINGLVSIPDSVVTLINSLTSDPKKLLMYTIGSIVLIQIVFTGNSGIVEYALKTAQSLTWPVVGLIAVFFALKK